MPGHAARNASKRKRSYTDVEYGQVAGDASELEPSPVTPESALSPDLHAGCLACLALRGPSLYTGSGVFEGAGAVYVGCHLALTC